MNDAERTIPAEFSGFSWSNIDEGKKCYENYMANLKKRWPDTKIAKFNQAQLDRADNRLMSPMWKTWDELRPSARRAIVAMTRAVSEDIFYPLWDLDNKSISIPAGMVFPGHDLGDYPEDGDEDVLPEGDEGGEQENGSE